VAVTCATPRLPKYARRLHEVVPVLLQAARRREPKLYELRRRRGVLRVAFVRAPVRGAVAVRVRMYVRRRVEVYCVWVRLRRDGRRVRMLRVHVSVAVGRDAQLRRRRARAGVVAVPAVPVVVVRRQCRMQRRQLRRGVLLEGRRVRLRRRPAGKRAPAAHAGSERRRKRGRVRVRDARAGTQNLRARGEDCELVVDVFLLDVPRRAVVARRAGPVRARGSERATRLVAETDEDELCAGRQRGVN
jgi:hypothetical protein